MHREYVLQRRPRLPWEVKEWREMDTNFQMLKALMEEYTPEERGFASGKEIQLIKAKLHLEEMDVLQLRILRDFTVMFLGDRTDRQKDFDGHMVDWDRMSAITHVIDTILVSKGQEV
jgi:anti-sigma factor RsiW